MSQPGRNADLLSDQQVDIIATRLAERLSASSASPTKIAAAHNKPSSTPRAELGEGVFATVDDAVAAAGVAFRELDGMTLDGRHKIIASIRESMFEHAEELARHAQRETGLGRVEHKLIKTRLVTRKTGGPEVLQPQAVTGDNGLTLTEYAPYGVIGAIIPSTNPTSTVICNTIGMVAAGNAVIFNGHPGARSCSNHTAQLINEAIVEAGGPPNLVSALAEPTIETAQQIMHHPGIQLLTVTGGAAVVRAALSSGKRAICAGPGNPPVVVDETADLEQAGRDIVRGASFDNNIICIDEKMIFAVESIADELVRVMCQHGTYEINSWQFNRLMKSIFVQIPPAGQHGAMNKDFIGKNASVLLKEIGIDVGDEIRLILVQVERDHPLVLSEQMMPIIPLVRVGDANKGIDLAKRSEHGFRHTAVMHSKNLDHLSRMAREMSCSIFVKNAPSYAGVGYGGEGFCSFTIASPTGEGITNPISFSRIRRCILKDAFRIV